MNVEPHHAWQRFATRECPRISDEVGATFWMHVSSELKQRGVQDILIFCVDGLKGFPETPTHS
jgi:transposase-like protein